MSAGGFHLAEHCRIEHVKAKTGSRTGSKAPPDADDYDRFGEHPEIR